MCLKVKSHNTTFPKLFWNNNRYWSYNFDFYWVVPIQNRILPILIWTASPKPKTGSNGPPSSTRCLMAAVGMGHHGPTIPIFHGLWPARRFFAWSRFLFVIDVYISPPPVTVTDYPLQFPMTSSGVSSYRDRTSEFRSLSERMKKIGGMAVANHAEDDPATSRSLASASSRSEFNKKASRIGLGIHEACLKISRLAKCMPIAFLIFLPFVSFNWIFDNLSFVVRENESRGIGFWILSFFCFSMFS